MSSMVDYTERATCPIFGDGAAAFMVEPTTEDVGIMDALFQNRVENPEATPSHVSLRSQY